MPPALMRVNHTGEVCAQALYAAQALTARDADARTRLQQAAREEEDHLAWTQQRLERTRGPNEPRQPDLVRGLVRDRRLRRPGRRSPRASGFVVETERQVEEHLTGHMDRLPLADARSRTIVAAMRDDEVRHGMAAQDAGARELPWPLRALMRATAKLMTVTAYRL